MHIFILLALGIGIALAVEKSQHKELKVNLHPRNLSPKHLLALANIKAFADGIRRGLTVKKTDVVKFRNLALKYSSPELAGLTLVLMQLKDSGMSTYQAVK